MEKLQKQLDFIMEIDKIKEIFRHTSLFNKKDRKENDAEHSWHICMMALTLQEYSNEKNIDILRVLKMLLIHDLIEIYAGDYILYTDEVNIKKDKEKKGAEKIFGLLPDKQRDEYLEIWNEFEAKKSPEAKFATALDRLEPILQNYTNHGGSWLEYDIPYDKIMDKNSVIGEGSETIWRYAKEIIEDSLEKGYIKS